MQYQLLYPISVPLYGTCFEDAIQNFVRLNYNIGLNQLIASENEKRYEIQLKQYQADTRNRVGFDVYAFTGSLPTPMSVYDNYRFWNPTSSFIYNGIPYSLGSPYVMNNYAYQPRNLELDISIQQ